MWVESAEGEDLMMHFRPLWVQTPDLLTMPPGGDSYEDKKKSALDAARARTTTDKVAYKSFACFSGHVMNWGYKMIITKVFAPVDLISYLHNLTNVVWRTLQGL